MKLTILAILLAVGVGLILGGRFANLATFKARWHALGPLGLFLQVLPASGKVLPLVLLEVSLGLLMLFAMANVRLPGGAAILVGVLLNLAVISWNHGMPVTRQALVDSNQQGTLNLLINDGGAKHHLAGPGDGLLPLADVIPIGWGIDQVVSIGDIFTYVGLGWLLVGSMKREPAATSTTIGAAESADGYFVFVARR